jgi:hypothetical protein
MSDIAHNTEHVADAMARLLEQFKNQPNLEDLFECLLTPNQTAEDLLYDLYTLRWLDTAEGVHLDNLGEIVGQPREGRTDSVYRLWIKARILLNRSTGKGDDLLQLMQIVATDANLNLTEQYPAGLLVEIWELDSNAQAVYDLLHAAKAAGIRLHFTYSTLPVTDLFTYDTGPGYDTGTYAGDIGV